MTPTQFVEKWTQLNNLRLSERTGYQTHFNDLCEVLRHPKPLEQPNLPEFAPENFTFEKRAAMVGSKGGHGWADVWKNRAFAFEYKKRDRNLDDAYGQLIRYHDDLGNVPVLATCDFVKLHFHIKRTNHKTVERVIPLENFESEPNQRFLRDVFYRPDVLDVGEQIEKITQRVAGQLAAIALSMSTPERYGAEPIRVARFLDRVVFTLFAEDCGLLPRNEFQKIVDKGPLESLKISRQINNLWRAMSTGEDFGATEIRHFNGALFDEVLEEEEPLILHPSEVRALQEAAHQNWAEIDNSIFGSIFERAIDPKKRSLLGKATQSSIDQIEEAKRSQLGAHYTSRADIETLIEPVIIAPLRDEWNKVKSKAENRLEVGDEIGALNLIESWLENLGQLRVLDPACGSGNFLFVALQKLLDLEHVARKWSKDYLDYLPRNRVHPRNFYGIEVSIYAHDLARVSVWISYLQWIRQNGYEFHHDPVLESIESIQRADALFDMETGVEKEWPEVDYIIGNPPFLGASKIMGELGRPYQAQLWKIYGDRVPGAADLCCYWFDKARLHIKQGKAQRAGLVATQAIRGGANREVLKGVKKDCEIFFAISDRDWILEGANVHISLIAFDDKTQQEKELDGQRVSEIFANLTPINDVTKARKLKVNEDIAFYGSQQKAPFDITTERALMMLSQPNPHKKPNSDVLKPSMNGVQLLRRGAESWVIDFALNENLSDVELYEAPFLYAEQVVKPIRANRNEERQKRFWWLHARPSPRYRRVMRELSRYIVTSAVSKHHIMVWMDASTLVDHALVVFAYADNYSFGMLQSRVHELWALKLGTQLEDRPRYTPTTCFETFPFPMPTNSQMQTISDAALRLDELRTNWLNPPEWLKEETLEFPATAGGPWHNYLVPDSTNERGIGTARWTRLIPNNPNRPVVDVRFDPSKNINGFRNHHVTTKDALSHRTLTNLYNHPQLGSCEPIENWMTRFWLPTAGM